MELMNIRFLYKQGKFWSV